MSPSRWRARCAFASATAAGETPASAQGLAAALLGDGAAPGRRGGVAGQGAGPGPFPPGGAALADRGVEDQAGRQRGGPQLAGLRALQGLAAFQAERLAVRVLGP